MDEAYLVGLFATTRFLYDGDELVGEFTAAGTLLRRPPRMSMCPAHSRLVAPWRRGRRPAHLA